MIFKMRNSSSPFRIALNFSWTLMGKTKLPCQYKVAVLATAVKGRQNQTGLGLEPVGVSFSCLRAFVAIPAVLIRPGQASRGLRSVSRRTEHRQFPLQP